MTRRRIQVAVVLAVLTVAAGALNSAVQSVRDAADRLTCACSNCQLTLAVHNYHDTNNRYPPGTMPNDKLTPDERLSWLVALCPFMESSDLYSRFDKEASYFDPRNAEATHVPYSPYTCRTFAPKGSIYTTYVGVAGVGPDAATLKIGEKRAGFFGYDRKLKTDDISDGTSQTLLIVETWADPSPWAKGGAGTVRGFDPATAPYVGAGRALSSGHIAERNWFAPNGIGVNVALADGSRRFLKESVDPKVLEAMATIAGGEEITWDW